MTVGETIRTQFPLSLAKRYEAVLLEGEPQLRVIRLIELYESSVRHLALVGLAAYRHLNLSDEAVEEAREGLARPSLGHWMGLFKGVDVVLRQPFPHWTLPPLNRRHRDDPIAEAVEQIGPLVGTELPKRVRLSFFLDLLVEFRNKKIGHGSLSTAEARRVVDPLEAGLIHWLGEIGLLQERPLIYIDKVEWQDPHFVYSGTNLSTGVSLYPARLEGEAPVTPRQVYLDGDADALIPLHPFFAFDGDEYRFFVYNELSNQGHPVLRCPYEPSSLRNTLELDGGADLILPVAGEQPPETPEPQPEPEPEPQEIDKTKGSGMPNSWFDIIHPHADIREGHFDEAVFAADLGDVVNETAADDYRDPYLFYKKTYLTAGLNSLLTRVHAKLTTGQGPSVIQIQTPFGGGKTHALVAIYHYLEHGERVEGLLPPGVDLLSPRLAAVAGNHWNPLEGVTSFPVSEDGRTTDGITRRTFWGDVAYQIGGRAGYEAFRENDEKGIAPGKEKLRGFLEAHQPFVILFDEILEYINKALDVREQTDVSLGTQTFSFFQELTEAVSILPRGMLVVTLPSSHLEDFGDREEESLARLGKIFGRVESIETPVQGEEVYAVIRRRLFEEEGLRRVPMRETIHRYFQLYVRHKEDLPAKARAPNYREKMEMAYPFHPDLLDILYEKWSTFPTFQRTRGVLRLLANVVEDLYQREVPLDLILPSDINLGNPTVRQEFLKHIGPEYEGVIGSDIAGHEAKAQALDKANRPWKHLAERVSTAVFFHSFTADDSEKGISLPYIKLATLRSDAIPALVTDVLQKLSNELWYLNTRADAYFFSRIPNLNRMILDKKELFNESYEEEMQRIIQAEMGRKFSAYLWPETGEGIPDNRDLKLVILRPDDAGDRIPQWIERRGEGFREYKNTLFFALADTAGFAKLREDVKTTLALQEIKAGVDSGETPQLETRRDEIQRRLHAIQRDFSYNVRRMYHTLQIGERRVDLGHPVTGNESLSNWYWRELTSIDVGAIATQLGHRILVAKFLAQQERVATSVVLDQFYKNPALPAPAEVGIVARAIQLGVKEGVLGLAEVSDGVVDPRTLRYGAAIPLEAVAFEPDVVLVAKAVCEELRVQLAPETETGEDEQPESVIEAEEAAPVEAGGEIAPPQEERYRRVRLVITGVPAGKIADVNRGILMPISRAVGDFAFTLEIDVASEEGVSKAEMENTIKETVRQIGATLHDETLEL